MSTMIIWVLGIGISVAGLVTTAALKQFYIHMAIAAAISILMALASFAATRGTADDDVSKARAASANLRHMGLVWSWGAIGLLVTYAFDILTWREWWQFFLGFFVFAGLSLFLAAILQKDADEGLSDATIFNITRGVAVFMLFAMVITMVGLLVDGKMWRFLTEAGLRRGWQDWAANNIFFFGAMALAAISWNTITLLGWRKPVQADTRTAG